MHAVIYTYTAVPNNLSKDRQVRAGTDRFKRQSKMGALKPS